MGKTAVITGITGQDGFYLTSLLLSKGYVVVGLVRHTSMPTDQRISQIKHQNLFLVEGDLTDVMSIYRIIKDYQPDEFYHLGAQSHVGESFKIPISTLEINGIGTLNCLEAIRNVKPDTKFYFAGSSEMFGNHLSDEYSEDRNIIVPLDEQSPMTARSPYGASKIYGYHITKNYREAYGMFAAAGILFNHSSPIRGETFVSRKITMGVADIMAGRIDKLALGNLDASRDWFFAGDAAKAMYKILQQAVPRDFVIAMGQDYSIRHFLDIAFGYVNLDWKKFVIIDQKFFRPSELHTLVGNAGKAYWMLGWKPTVAFDTMVEMMVRYDMADPDDKRKLIGDELLQGEQNG